MSDFVKVSTTPEVWAVIHASHKGRLQLYGTFSDPDGTFGGGSGERGVMDTGYSLDNTDYPILWARTEWDIAPDGKRSNETHRYWLCVAIREAS